MRVNNEIMDAKEGVFTAPIRWAKTWEELGYINGAYVDNYSQIYEGCDFKSVQETENTFATKEQAEQYGIIAAQLSQLVAQLNGEPNWKPKMDESVYCVDYDYCDEKLVISNYVIHRPHFPIKTKEAAEFSLKHHANLWRKFYGI